MDKSSDSKTPVKNRDKKKSFGRRLWEFVRSWGTVILIVLAIRAFVIEAFTVPTGSMEDTILAGDFLLVNKFVYGFKAPFTNVDIIPGRMPYRGDIIVFRYPRNSRWPEPEGRYARFFPKWFPLLPIFWDRKEESFHWYSPRNYVKRCVALPGDTLEIVNKRLYVNGAQLDKSTKAVYKETETLPRLVPRSDFAYRWFDLIAFRFADSLHYSDTLAYQEDGEFNIPEFADIRRYYDSLFVQLYYDSGINPRYFEDYVMNFYANPDFGKYLSENNLASPLPPRDCIDLKGFFNRVYTEYGFDTIPSIDSLYFTYYIMHRYMRDNFGPVVIPEGMIFGMGDNRDQSEDCRYWGVIPVDLLKGSTMVTYYSLGEGPNLFARILHTKWRRIGRVVN
ncbi:signal peptidase I [candidate division WOR-3 bacterium]|uniref:Signal peptidase I n=1 Tax=candidate division WOR-3 bacterium TaxID=2052148 RepID=A0A9D5KBJ0_UNCW3|nr:signal peptidase I [candidate division WOR-3 bacterium]MBD3364731.1 signal peptidase I [candidate division WOR-3 bacterium]